MTRRITRLLAVAAFLLGGAGCATVPSGGQVVAGGHIRTPLGCAAPLSARYSAMRRRHSPMQAMPHSSAISATSAIPTTTAQSTASCSLSEVGDVSVIWVAPFGGPACSGAVSGGGSETPPDGAGPGAEGAAVGGSGTSGGGTPCPPVPDSGP